MPQINSGKSPPWVSGEIVTAAGLNGMIDSATLDPSAITAQSNFTTLTGDEYTLIVDPSTGLLKKTQLKNALLTGEDVITDNIFGKSINGTLIIQPQGSTSSLNIYGGSVGGSVGAISGYAKNISLTANSSVDNTGAFTVTAGTGGMSFDAGNAPIDFLSRTDFAYTSAIKLPVGTTAERPATPVAGDARFNSTTSKLEFYNGSSWKSTQEQISAGLMLYDVYEEVGVTVSAITHDKPLGELWIVEIQSNYTTTGAHIKFPTYSASSENIFLGDTYNTSAYDQDWITFRKVYNSSTTFTTQTFGFFGWSGAAVSWGNCYFRIYKYKPVA
jgi:hypothetical protein